MVYAKKCFYHQRPGINPFTRTSTVGCKVTVLDTNLGPKITGTTFVFANSCAVREQYNNNVFMFLHVYMYKLHRFQTCYDLVPRYHTCEICRVVVPVHIINKLIFGYCAKMKIWVKSA